MLVLFPSYEGAERPWLGVPQHSLWKPVYSVLVVFVIFVVSLTINSEEHVQKKVSFRSLVRFPGIIRTENSNNHSLLSNFIFSPKYKHSKKDWRKFCHIIKTKLFCSMTLRSSSAGLNTFLRNSTLRTQEWEIDKILPQLQWHSSMAIIV